MTPSGPTPGPAAAAPAVVLWEVARDPEAGRPRRDELSTLEGVRLLNEVRCFGRIPLQLVGRPLRRADVGVLVEHGARIGLLLRLATGPDPLHPEVAADLRDAGLSRVVLAADARPAGALLAEVGHARALGLGVHVHSRVTAELLAALPARGRAYAEAGVHVWTLAFPVTGALPAAELEDALRRIVAVAPELPLQLEVAGAPHVVRVLAANGAPAELVTRAPREGEGVLYIAADGSAYPVAELPLVLGNVRHDDVVDLFRDSPVLCALRDPQRLAGRCGVCDFAYLCGGSRARAHAVTGDWLAADPACAAAADAADDAADDAWVARPGAGTAPAVGPVGGYRP